MEPETIVAIMTRMLDLGAMLAICLVLSEAVRRAAGEDA